MKSKVLCTTPPCTMGTTSWLLVIICMVLVHNTDLTSSAPTEINSPGNDHVTGIYPTATISPTTRTTKMMMTTTTSMPMTSDKSWSSQKPSRSKHITKSNLYKKPSKDKGSWAKVPFLSPTLVPTGYDVEKDISRHKEAAAPMTSTTTTIPTTIDTVVDNVNGPKDYTNKNRTNTSTLRHFDSLSSVGVSDRVESILSTNANGDEDSGKDIDFISDSRTTKADETYATTEGYHAKAAEAVAALSTTTMPTSRVENPVSNMETFPLGHVKGVEKSIVVAVTPTLSPIQSKSMPVNASLSFSSPLATTIVSPSSAAPKLPDVGHDGVKVTKKKQLFDKHFIAAAASSPSGSLLHPSMRKDYPWPSLSMNKPTKSNFAGAGSKKKLMEVPNGYLGPIMMKEKTFSVSHNHGKKPKPSLVEQKLKDKKLVEIIAPTALMEPISKAKNSQPEFVAIDMKSTMTTIATATTTTASTITEGVNTSTEIPPISAKIKKKEIESATATTYFLVVTQEGREASSKEIAGKTARPPIYHEMEPLNSGEIETTLREIYAEVINAMEGGSRVKTTSTEINSVTENKSNPATTSLPPNPSSSGMGNTKPSDFNQPYFESDHQQLLENNQQAHDVKKNVNQMNEYASSTTDSTFNLDGKPQTLNIFDKHYLQDSGKQMASATHVPTTENSRLTMKHFTSPASDLDQIAITDHATLSPSKISEIISIDSAGKQKNLPEIVQIIPQESAKTEASSNEDLKIHQNTSPGSSGKQKNLPKIDQIVTQVTIKAEDSTSEDPKKHKSSFTHPTSLMTDEELNKFKTPSETPLFLLTKSLNIKDSTDSKERRNHLSTDSSTSVNVLIEKVPEMLSLSTLSDKPIVTVRSFMESSISATSQSYVSSTKVPTMLSDKSLVADLSEASTIKNPIEDTSLTTTQSSTVDLIVDNTRSDKINHLTSFSKTTSVDSFPLLNDRSSPIQIELSSESSISSHPVSTAQTTNMTNDTTRGYIFTTQATSEINTNISSENEDHSSNTGNPTDKTTPKSLPVFKTIDYHDPKTTDSTSSVQHDSFTVSPSVLFTTNIPILTISSTKTDPEKNSSFSHQTLPVLDETVNSEPAESKISDIQIEVYDSTLEPILAATNFKHSTDITNPSSHITKKHSNKEHPQERFTQYVVDRSSDFATQESSAIARTPGKPEPAAIEIHINVSEGFGNESEDLEFLYRQSDFRKFPSKKPPNSLKPFDLAPQNETSNEAAEEIVVEIIDGNLNSTENSASRENLNVNPIFTFRSDDDSQVELKNVKYYPEDRPKDGPKSTDDFFVPHVGQHPSSANKALMDRDSDTIFYISNTEVKVGESLPTANTYDTQMKKSRLESQFFPANYEEHKKAAPQRYEEDIILSPPKNGPLKVIRRPLDISYVGESIMEVEQVTLTTTITPQPVPGSITSPDVIIEPAVLPEMAIGVPVIGELPPQIELKEIDYMPNFDGNKEESSIQYGGDLIDEGGAMGVGFDMDSYPLGNLGGIGNRNGAAISSQMLFNHRVNHLKKEVFSADLGGSAETADGNDLLRQSNDSVNGTAVGEKMGNATAYSVMEDQTALNDFIHLFTMRTMVFIGLYTLIPIVLVILLMYIWRDYNRKYKRNPFNAMGRNSSTDPLDAEKGNGGDGDGDGVESPEELRASSLAFGAATTNNTPSLEICTDSNEATNGNASDGDGRSNSDSRAASDTMDLGEIKTYKSGDVQEENSTLTIHCCNIESPRPQQLVSSNIPPQSTTITTDAAAAVAAATVIVAGAKAAVAAATNGSSPGTMHSNYSGPNGSITTMTLKNNHLIVETEERNDISRDTRVTKMHYNNSEKDGVFVVEVSRGADSKIMPGSPVSDPTEKRPFNIDADVKIVQSDTESLLSNHEKVQVHPPPPPENLINHDEIDTNHLHQIDEVDEFEECPRFAKNSSTGLSQSDLSSSSSVDSNKRYSYGNQELYTIEKQDYTTPSPTATKAPHPHAESKNPQPENHNDDNGHPENGHCIAKSPAPAPKCDSSIPPPPTSFTSTPSSSANDKVHDMNGHESVIESKPKITAALLKQDTVVVNEVTNGSSHHDNGNEDDDEKANEGTPQNPTILMMENSLKSSEPAAEIKALAEYSANTENGFDSIISLPDPPSTEEIKQMNDIILMETNQLDSLPPPPPPSATTDNHQHHNGNGISAPFVAGVVDQNGDSHSIVSSSAAESPQQTPTKVMKPLVPPTITVADTSALTTTDIPVHTNGNCMTGHATTAIAVEVSGSS